MTSQERAIKTKVEILLLAKQLGNISQACKAMGYSRDSYYRFKKLYNTGGETALQEINRRKPNMKNRVHPEVEQEVVNCAYAQPAYGQLRASRELKKRGILVSPGGVRNIWLRHDLATFKERLKALETKTAQEKLILTESQLAAVERVKKEGGTQGDSGTAELSPKHPGYLGVQFTYYVGNIKGLGPIYQQTFIDAYTKTVFCKLYDGKNALAAVDILKDRVMPFFKEQGIPLLQILTDRCGEYCGQRDQHGYEKYLEKENIKHRKTKLRPPHSNGICEGFNRICRDEFYGGLFRHKAYRNIRELQLDLDKWVWRYNEKRSCQGKYCYGKTPMQTFRDSISLAKKKPLERRMPSCPIKKSPSHPCVGYIHCR
jgi:hypothetical protein